MGQPTKALAAMKQLPVEALAALGPAEAGT